MELLEEVKNYLDITWNLTDEEEQKLTGMIERGKRTLEDKIGTCDFDNDTQEKSLLLNYVLYDRSGALADFWQNYKGELLSLRLGNKVKQHAEKEQAV